MRLNYWRRSERWLNANAQNKLLRPIAVYSVLYIPFKTLSFSLLKKQKGTFYTLYPPRDEGKDYF